jgi:hypothetical protein
VSNFEVDIQKLPVVELDTSIAGIEVETCTACGGLKRFTQRHQFNRIFL